MNTEAYRYNDYKRSFPVAAPGHHKITLAFVISAILFFITSYCCLYTCFHLFCHPVQNNKNTYCLSHFAQYVKFQQFIGKQELLSTFLPKQGPKDALSMAVIYSVITY